MALAQGRASRYVSKDMGATSPGRWQPWHRFCRIDSTSLLNVICEGTLAACETSVAQAPMSTVRRNIVHLRLPFSIRFQLLLKPCPRQTGDLLERARFLEKMCRSGNNFQPLFNVEVLEGFAVHLDNRLVLAADNQQRRSLHAMKDRNGK